MCSDLAGPSSSGSGDLFELSDRLNKTDPESLNRARMGGILDLGVTASPILPFGACYVIMHKVYSKHKCYHVICKWLVVSAHTSNSVGHLTFSQDIIH